MTLPAGWIQTTLGRVVRPTRPKVKPRDYPDLPFIGMEHIEAHTMKLLGTVPASSMRSAAVKFEKGDVLYGRLRPYLNKVYKPDFDGLCSAEFIVFPSSTELSSAYLQFFVNSLPFVSFASRLNTGDRPRVDFDQLADYPFPLPPRDEQDRIVSEIDKQFTRLGVANDTLGRIKDGLSRQVAALLDRATAGSWPVVKLAEVSQKITDGEHIQPPVSDSGVPLLSATNVRTEGVSFDEIKFVSAENALKSRRRCDPERGDILIVSRGATIGRSTVVNSDRAFCLMGSVILVKLLPTADSTFMSLVLRANRWRRKMIQLSGSTAQQAIYLRDIKTISVPCPPIDEQVLIAQSVQRTISIIAKVESQIVSSLRRGQLLRQQILAAAFCGKLVSSGHS